LVTKAQHRLLDIGVIAALAIAAIQPWMPVLAADRLTIGGVAVILGVVWMRSSFVDRRARPASAAASAPASAPVAAASSAATTPGATGSSSAAGDRSTEIGRTAGRAVGQGLRRARRLTRGSSEG
jgi:hypothetical protein